MAGGHIIAGSQHDECAFFHVQLGAHFNNSQNVEWQAEHDDDDDGGGDTRDHKTVPHSACHRVERRAREGEEKKGQRR